MRVPDEEAVVEQRITDSVWNPGPRCLAPLLMLVCCIVPAYAQAAVTFATQQAFATGTAPHGVAAGDLNADGKIDLVATNQSSASVSVLINTTAAGATTPTFATQQSFTVGVNPTSVAIADLDGDGKPDLIVTNASSSTISILRNTTPAGAAVPTFATQQTFATGAYPYSVAAADFDGDGKLDLVVANVGNSDVSVFRNTTAAGATTFTFAYPAAVQRRIGSGMARGRRRQRRRQARPHRGGIYRRSRLGVAQHDGGRGRFGQLRRPAGAHHRTGSGFRRRRRFQRRWQARHRGCQFLRHLHFGLSQHDRDRRGHTQLHRPADLRQWTRPRVHRGGGSRRRRQARPRHHQSDRRHGVSTDQHHDDRVRRSRPSTRSRPSPRARVRSA